MIVVHGVILGINCSFPNAEKKHNGVEILRKMDKICSMGVKCIIYKGLKKR